MNETVTGNQLWQGFQATPADVLFFRDSKPAALGADHDHTSIFPPFPSTLYGMVRTLRLLEEGRPIPLNEKGWKDLPEAVRSEVGEWGQFGSIRLRGPWLVRKTDAGDECLFPAPADLGLLLKKSTVDQVEDILRYRPIERDSRGGWSHPLQLLHPFRQHGNQWQRWSPSKGEADPTSPDRWFITSAGMRRWLAGLAPDPKSLVPARELWVTERRTGLKLINGNRYAEDGMLYTFAFIRLHTGVSIGFELSGTALEPGCRALLGGESRIVTLERGPTLGETVGCAPVSGDGLRAIYMATPGAFYGPSASLPADPVPVAAVVKSMIHIGGWDIPNHRPKTLLRGVAAGSVYWVLASQPLDQLASISRRHQEGFGVTLVGAA